MQGGRRAIALLSVRRPQPHNTNPQTERGEKKNSRTQRGTSSLTNDKALAQLLKSNYLNF